MGNSESNSIAKLLGCTTDARAIEDVGVVYDEKHESGFHGIG